MSTSSDNDEVAKAIAAAAQAAKIDDDSEFPETIFGKIAKKEIPCNMVYEDDTVIAFHDVNPQAPIHIILIPKDRDGLTQLSKAVGSHEAILGHLLFVASQLGKQYCTNGYRIVINDGKEGSQSVYHLHIHILGGRQMTWPPG